MEPLQPRSSPPTPFHHCWPPEQPVGGEIVTFPQTLPLYRYSGVKSLWCFNTVGGEILTFPDTPTSHYSTTQGLSLWCFNTVRDPRGQLTAVKGCRPMGRRPLVARRRGGRVPSWGNLITNYTCKQHLNSQIIHINLRVPIDRSRNVGPRSAIIRSELQQRVEELHTTKQRVINTGCSMEAVSRSSPMSTPFRMSTPRDFLHTETPSHSSSFLRNEGVAALRVHARPSLRSSEQMCRWCWTPTVQLGVWVDEVFEVRSAENRPVDQSRTGTKFTDVITHRKATHTNNKAYTRDNSQTSTPLILVLHQNSGISKPAFFSTLSAS